MEDLLATTVSTHGRWVSLTEAYLPKAFKRIKKQEKIHNHSLEEYGFDDTERTPRIHRYVGRVLFPSRFLPVSFRELSELAGASSFFHASFIPPAGDGLDSRRRVDLIQHKKYGLPRSGQSASSWRFFWRADRGTYS
jgi:hypothetical protein